MIYSDTLMNHFYHPRNVGRVESPDAIARVKYPPCTDYLEVSLRMSMGTVSEARFKAQGCGGAIAAGSALTGLLSGRSSEEMARLTLHDIVSALGSLPEGKTHCGQMALDAVRLLIGQLSGESEQADTWFETLVRH